MNGVRGTASVIAESLLRLLYPARCRSCGSDLAGDSRFFCSTCLDDIKYLEGPHCTGCGRPFPSGSGADHQCWECMKRTPAFDMARAPVAFGGSVRTAIHLFKYERQRAMMGFLGGFMEDAAARWSGGATLVVAVPLHKRRLRHRGFNQSLFLAERAAVKLGVPLSLDALTRTRYTRPQVDLDPSEREKNVRGAFSVTRPDEVKGQSVILVDDVYTTGATVNECARVLKKAGAKSVRVLTVAMAVDSRSL